jgi:hypothetical protein
MRAAAEFLQVQVVVVEVLGQQLQAEALMVALESN